MGQSLAIDFGGVLNLLLPVALSSTLTTIGVYILGRFTTAFDRYTSERIEILARLHAVDQLAEETRRLTKAAEEIKATLNDQVWDRQNRWIYKRDFYAGAIRSAAKIRNDLAHFGTMLGDDSQEQEGRKLGERIITAQSELVAEYDVAPIFASPEACEAFRSIIGAISGDIRTPKGVQLVNQALNVGLDRLRKAAKSDLGYAPPA